MRGATIAFSISTDSAMLFQSTLLMRGATEAAKLSKKSSVFQSTLLMRGATMRHRASRRAVSRFQSTLLMRGATISSGSPITRSNFNPRSSCEERPAGPCINFRRSAISIHAPHARSDCCAAIGHIRLREFQSTLLMRGATRRSMGYIGGILFQSTLLMRGAT